MNTIKMTQEQAKQQLANANTMLQLEKIGALSPQQAQELRIQRLLAQHSLTMSLPRAA